MADLDDRAAISSVDASGMLAVSAALPEHCREGYRLGRETQGLPDGEGVTGVAFCGMGGSGVAGDVIRAIFRDRLRTPIASVRGPELPAFCGPHTLVVVSSYSGGTAETLACFEEAISRGCRLLLVTSGGELARHGSERDLAAVAIPGGMMPRAALGYLALGAMGALEGIGLLPPLADDVEEATGELDRIVTACGADVPRERNAAKQLAWWIGDRVPVIWGAEGIGAAAAGRWKAQMNENAKVPAWSAALPELDHNEVVGWSEGQGARFCLIALRHPGEHPEVKQRFPLSIEIAESSGIVSEEVMSSGRSALSRLLSLVAVGDFASVYLGIARDIDPTPVEAIARLKNSLAGA